MNRCALAFGWGMIIAMIVFMSTAWFAFTITNQKISAEISSLPILENYYREQNIFTVYAETSSKLALSQAFYQITKDSAINISNPCRVINNIIVWNENCHPNKDFIKKRFLEYYNASFNSLILKYPNIKTVPQYTNVIDDNATEIISQASQIVFSSEKQGTFAKYNFSYNFEPSIKLNLTERGIYLKDFMELYDKIVACNKDLACIHSIELDNWNITVEDKNSFFQFKLKTKNSFIFYENNLENYSPIELNFIIEK